MRVLITTLALARAVAGVTINSYPATAVNVLINDDAPGSIDTLMPGTNMSTSLSQYYQTTLNNTLKIPGGALYISTSEGTLLKSFGSDTLNSYVPFSLENHFRVGSLTKTLVASAVLKLVSEGKIDMRDTWSKYYNGTQPFPYADEIMVRDLLGMTSGVYNYVRSREAAQIQSTDPTLPFSYDQIIEVILKNQPYYEPTDRQTANYSNSNYILLDHIVELTAGMPTAQYINTNFLQPLNLSADTLRPFDSYNLGNPAPEGYGPWPLTSATTYGNKTASNPSQALGAGAYVSNLQSLKIWIEATVAGYAYGGTTSGLHGERTFGYVHNLGQPLPYNVSFDYGYGLMKLNDYYGHDGSISGFTTVAFTNPKKNITLVCVGNTGPVGVTAKNAVEMLAMLDPDFLTSTGPAGSANINPPNMPNDTASGGTATRATHAFFAILAFSAFYAYS